MIIKVTFYNNKYKADKHQTRYPSLFSLSRPSLPFYQIQLFRYLFPQQNKMSFYIHLTEDGCGFFALISTR